MRVVLRCRITDQSVNDAGRYRQVVLDIARLTIGRGADQLIQLTDPRTARAHAVIEQRRGVLRVRALARAPLRVNDGPCRQSILRLDDVVTVFDAHLTVEDARADGVTVLRLRVPIERSFEDAPSRDAHTLKQARLRSAPLSWILVLWVLLLLGVAPLLSSLSETLTAPTRDTALPPRHRVADRQ
jgi:hypothetical protein